ncbi:MAG: hypothetical protein VXX66_08325 [Actinomycetota bacterium]|nr:hypothetical protein [Actinomycetota bacterium]
MERRTPQLIYGEPPAQLPSTIVDSQFHQQLIAVALLSVLSVGALIGSFFV